MGGMSAAPGWSREEGWSAGRKVAGPNVITGAVGRGGSGVIADPTPSAPPRTLQSAGERNHRDAVSSRRRSMGLRTVIWLLLLGLPAPVAGGEPGEPGGGITEEEAKTQAQPIFARGLELLKEQRWSEGLEAFSQAYAILPSPILRFNIGYCQRALGQYVAALETLRRFLAEPTTGVAATRRGEAEAYVKELEARVVRLAVAVPPELRPDLEVSIDGRPASLDGEGKLLAILDPGRHTVQARRPGFVPCFQDRDLRPGEEARVEVRLEPLPARIQVSSNVPRADVSVDGKRVGLAPWDGELLAGRHRIEVVAPGYFPHASELNLAPGGAARVTADLVAVPPRPTPIYRRWWFWGGVGAVLGGVATVTYFVARPEPQPPPYEPGSLGWVVGGE